MRVSSTSANVVPLLEISAGEIIEILRRDKTDRLRM